MRNVVVSFSSILVLSAGCSSGVTTFFPDGGFLDGGNSIVIDGKSDGGKKDGGVKKDTGTEEEEDAGEEETDAGKVDSGKKDSSTPPPVCQPESVSGFSPSWKAPKPIHSSACTQANAQMVVDCSFDSSMNQTTCDTFLNNTVNAACVQCVLTDKTATTYGPVIMDGSVGSLNIAGCVAALSGNTMSSGCGAKFQALQQCRDASCANCPDPSSSQQAFDDFQQCGIDAEGTECASYVTASSCIDALIDTGGSANACAAGATFLDNARTIAKIFCAP